MKGKLKAFLLNKGGIFSCVLALMLATASLNYYVYANGIQVTLKDDENNITIESEVKTVGEILEDANVKLSSKDIVSPDLDTRLTTTSEIRIKRYKTIKVLVDGNYINIGTNAISTYELEKTNAIELGANDSIVLESTGKGGTLENGEACKVVRAYPVSVSAGGTEAVVYASKGTVRDIIEKSGVAVGKEDIICPSVRTEISQGMEIVIIRVTKATIEDTVSVPFEVIRRPNDNMQIGTEQVVAEGSVGEKKVTSLVTYHNGVEYKRDSTEAVTKSPVSKVIEYGQKAVPVISKMATEETKTINGYKYKQVLNFSATAYCDKGTTASGRTSQVGVVAVDPRVIPLGTKLYIAAADGSWSYGYCVAGDTGGAIKGNIVDLFMNAYSDCIQFGRKKCVVYVLSD
ncbi:MAG: 3D domain-containing protein [Bacillota bacterium]|nr:3D domain-containing protein [Bacillota bacterium]